VLTQLRSNLTITVTIHKQYHCIGNTDVWTFEEDVCTQYPLLFTYDYTNIAAPFTWGYCLNSTWPLIITTNLFHNDTDYSNDTVKLHIFLASNKTNVYNQWYVPQILQWYVRIWKETVLAYLKVLSQHSVNKLRFGKYLLNTSLEC
jgi:hypothetical protein